MLKIVAAAFAGAVSVLAALAACGGGASRASDATSAVFGESDPVRVGTVFSFSGASLMGESLHRSVELAAADFGLVAGREIVVQDALDTNCSAEGGRAAALQTAANLDVIGVVGTSCSVAAVAASPVLSEAGVPMVSPSNTSPALTSDLTGNAGTDYHPGYFRVSNNDLYQGEAVARFAYGDLGLRRMVTLDDGDPYTRGLAESFADSFRALGGEIAAVERIAKGDRDLSETAARFAAASPDGVFFPIFVTEGVPFMRQARAEDGLSDAVFIAGGALLASDFLAVPETLGAYIAGPQSVYPGRNSATGKSADEILAAYEARYGAPPASPYWGLAYDAATLLLAGAARSARMELTSPFPWDGGEVRLRIVRSELREAIGAASADFDGLSGRIACDEFGDCGSGRVIIYRHADPAVTDPALLEVAHRYEYEGK